MPHSTFTQTSDSSFVVCLIPRPQTRPRDYSAALGDLSVTHGCGGTAPCLPPPFPPGLIEKVPPMTVTDEKVPFAPGQTAPKPRKRGWRSVFSRRTPSRPIQLSREEEILAAFMGKYGGPGGAGMIR